MSTPEPFSYQPGEPAQTPPPGPESYSPPGPPGYPGPQGYPPPAQPGYPGSQGYPPPAQPGYPQPGYPAYPVSPYGVSDKDKMTAGLLQIFLGSFGVGRFYLGYTGIGVAQIAVTWLTCGIGAIWPLIDGIMMLVGNVPDAQGRPLRG